MASRALSYGVLSERVLSSPCKLAVSHSCKGFRKRRLSLSASSSSSASSSEGHHLHSPPPQRTHVFSSTAPEPLPPPSPIHQQWHLTDQHLFLFTTIACVTGGAVTALFVAAIPTMLAFKKAAESLEKLLEVTREELPGTMAAVRLSGMEISDLTMELSELGQEISSGVKSSARAVRAAQDGLRRVSSIASAAFLQEKRALKAGSTKPAVGVAMATRRHHERFMALRMMLRSVSTLKYILGWIGKLWRIRRRQLPTRTTSIHVS